MDEVIYKVGARTDVKKLSTAIGKAFLENPEMVIQAIGELPNNQAIKGIARAIGFLKSKGIDAAVLPYFGDIEHNRKEGTATVMCYRLIQIEN